MFSPKNRFPNFRSLWIIFWECKYYKPSKTCIIKYLTSFSLNLRFLFIISLRVSINIKILCSYIVREQCRHWDYLQNYAKILQYFYLTDSRGSWSHSSAAYWTRMYFLFWSLLDKTRLLYDFDCKDFFGLFGDEFIASCEPAFTKKVAFEIPRNCVCLEAVVFNYVKILMSLVMVDVRSTWFAEELMQR